MKQYYEGIASENRIRVVDPQEKESAKERSSSSRYDKHRHEKSSSDKHRTRHDEKSKYKSDRHDRHRDESRYSKDRHSHRSHKHSRDSDKKHREKSKYDSGKSKRDDSKKSTSSSHSSKSDRSSREKQHTESTNKIEAKGEKVQFSIKVKHLVQVAVVPNDKNVASQESEKDTLNSSSVSTSSKETHSFSDNYSDCAIQSSTDSSPAKRVVPKKKKRSVSQNIDVLGDILKDMDNQK